MNAFGILNNSSLELWSVIMLVTLCATALYTDVRYGVIPNWLNLTFGLGGVIIHTIVTAWSGFFYALIGMSIGFLAVWLLYVFGAVGAGDVKLFAAIGSLVGWQHSLLALLYSILFAGIIALFVVLYRIILQIKRRSRILSLPLLLAAPSKNEKMSRFPFMLAIFPAISVYIADLLWIG